MVDEDEVDNSLRKQNSQRSHQRVQCPFKNHVCNVYNAFLVGGPSGVVTDSEKKFFQFFFNVALDES